LRIDLLTRIIFSSISSAFLPFHILSAFLPSQLALPSPNQIFALVPILAVSLGLYSPRALQNREAIGS